MTEKQKEICAKIFQHYGIENQTVKAVEELAELQKAICKSSFSPNRYNLIEEMADVLIMMEQIKCAYFISDNDINEIIKMKLQRQQERMKNETY